MKITAEQRARLTELFAKGDDLTEVEAAEKKYLSALAGKELAAELLAEAEGGGDDDDDDGGAGDDDDGGGEGGDGGAADASLSVGQRISAMVSSNKALAGKIAAANAKAKTALANLAAMTERATKAEASVTELTGQLEEANTTIASLKAEAKTTDEAVTQALAGLNIPRAKMPKKAGGGSAEQSIEKLNAEIEATDDPKLKGQLANQAWELMKAQGAVGDN